MRIYDFESYRVFLTSIIDTEIDRGSKGRLAKAADCNPSWMTRVLAGEVHLSPDQALGITRYLQLNDPETDYFMALVDLERAATPLLRQRLQKKLKDMKTKSKNFGSLVRADGTLSKEHKALYYSSWIYSALHVACMLEVSSLSEIVSRLGVTREDLSQGLLALEEMGLVSKQSGSWRTTSKNIHLDSAEFLAAVGHRNWRERTIQHLQKLSSQGLHYSAIHALSEKDLDIIRGRLQEAILDCRKTIEDSPSETLSVLCLDWYRV